MSTRMFLKGLQYFANADVDFDAATIRGMMLDPAADTHVKAITGATVATPSVITCTGNGWSNGDLVVIMNVGGTTSVNGTFVIAGQAANSFTLKTIGDNQDVVGVGTYTSGGFAINLTQAATLDQLSAGRIANDPAGTNTDVTLTGTSLTNGVLKASNATCTHVTGAVRALLLYKFVTNDAASLPLVFIDGKQIVKVAATAASSATTIWVERLPGAINNGTTIVFSNGVSATLTVAAAAGDRSLTVSAIAAGITAGHQADVATSGAGYPLAPSDGTVVHTFDATNGIITI